MIHFPLKSSICVKNSVLVSHHLDVPKNKACVPECTYILVSNSAFNRQVISNGSTYPPHDDSIVGCRYPAGKAKGSSKLRNR